MLARPICTAVGAVAAFFRSKEDDHRPTFSLLKIHSAVSHYHIEHMPSLNGEWKLLIWIYAGWYWLKQDRAFKVLFHKSINNHTCMLFFRYYLTFFSFIQKELCM